MFSTFQPKPSNIVCMDEVVGRLNSKRIYRWFAKCPTTKVASGWLLSTVRNFLMARSLVRMVNRRLGFDPKIWVTDGLECYHTALLNEYPRKLRTIFLGRKPKPKTPWLTKDIEANCFLISKRDNVLVVEKGLEKPEQHMIIDDKRHYTTTIMTVLALFNKHKASIVCIMAPEKSIPFMCFSERFIKATKKDGYVYHTIGSCTNGNSWAEAMSKMIKRRIKWFDRSSRSFESAKLIFNIQMIVYNAFNTMGELDGKSPFEAAGVIRRTHKEIWNTLL